MSTRQAGLVALTLAVMLLAADGLFVALHLVHTFTPAAQDNAFSLGRDWSYGEVFGYLQLMWVVGLLGAAYWRAREPVVLAWAAAFTYLLADDALQVHERGGGWLGTWLSSMDAADAQALGEVAWSAGVGLVLLIGLGVAHRLSGTGARLVSWGMAACVVVLAGFGVGVDVVHGLLLPQQGLTDQLCALVEDGGELLAMTAACVFAAWSLATVSVWMGMRDAAGEPAARAIGDADVARATA